MAVIGTGPAGPTEFQHLGGRAESSVNSSGAMTHGAVLDLLRRRGPTTRRSLLELTRLSRTTLVERIDTLQRLRLIREGQRGPTANGRPPVMLEFDDRSRITLALDIGASHTTVAVTDLSARRLMVQQHPIDLDSDPEKVLDFVIRTATEVLETCDPPSSELLGVGVSFPGLPGEAAGTIEAPAVLGHWDGAPVGDIIRRAFDVPVVLANDAHAMAYGEYLADGRRRTLLAVKVATGLGAGLVVDGRLHYGDSRGAGQFGHMRVPGLTELCSCGERGCLATVASGRALVRRLQRYGIANVDDIVIAVEDGHAEALAALTEAGQAVGTVLSGVVTMLDPGVVLFGGPLGRLEPFVEAARAPIKKLAYARTARGVEVGRMLLDDESAVTGLAALLVDTALEPSAVDHLVATGINGAEPRAHRTTRP